MNFHRVIEKLDDTDVSVVSATVNVICELSKRIQNCFSIIYRSSSPFWRKPKQLVDYQDFEIVSKFVKSRAEDEEENIACNNGSHA